MTEERDGEGRARAQPDLLASLPEERAAPASDPAALEELRAEVRGLGERLDRLREAVQAEPPAPVARVNGGEIMYRCGGAKMYHGHRR